MLVVYYYFFFFAFKRIDLEIGGYGYQSMPTFDDLSFSFYRTPSYVHRACNVFSLLGLDDIVAQFNFNGYM